ncbi:MAG TPA: HEPN/Toprim-associated domain-containing protein, partial [Blastocatellia bacterium]|nr:HEPN/Toprim-associated domain-containing protein [Blastocatellia bacterium]
MGSYSTLKIGNLRVLDTKWDWEPEVMTLFTEADKIVMPYKEAVEISEDEDEDYLPEYYFAYSAPLNIVKDRLELMGYTLRRVRQTFDTLLEE